MKTSRFLPLLAPMIVLTLSELYFFYPKLIYLSLVLSGLTIFFCLWQFSRLSEIDRRWWNYLILPALMSGAALSYSVFLGSRYLIQLILVLNAIFLYLYLRQVYYYLLKPAAYEVFSIENLSAYLNWLAFFGAAATIYGLQSFLNLPISYLILIILAVIYLLTYQAIWSAKIEFKAGLPFVLLASLILVELFWSVSFLPFNHNAAGFILAVCYYVITGLVKNHLLNRLDAVRLKIYLLIGAASLLLILFTSRWL